MSEIVGYQEEDKSIKLHVDKKNLGSFISGLLGQPQSIDKRIYSEFILEKNWLNNLLSSILQRVIQQNNADIVNIDATFGFSDNSRRKVQGTEQIYSFIETRDVICSSVKIDIKMLIHFPNKNIPEKQDIIIYFDSGYSINNKTNRNIGGLIYLEILHTERTWADDMLSLLEREIIQIKIPQNSLLKWLSNNNSLVSSSIIFILCVSFIYWIPIMNNIDAKYVHIINDAINLKPADIDLVNSKINILLQRELDRGTSSSYFLFRILLLAVSLFFAQMFSTKILIQIAEEVKSHILYSPASEKHREEQNKKKGKNITKSTISLIASILLGILGNFVYDYLKK